MVVVVVVVTNGKSRGINVGGRGGAIDCTPLWGSLARKFCCADSTVVFVVSLFFFFGGGVLSASPAHGQVFGSKGCCANSPGSWWILPNWPLENGLEESLEAERLNVWNTVFPVCFWQRLPRSHA